MEEHDKMYKEHLMELYKSPANYGNLENPTHSHTETNASCGDEITMQLLVSDGKIADVKFHGSGCVMSIVSSSLLSDKIKGMPVSEAINLSKDDVLELLKINLNPARLKCVTLPLYAIKNSLK
ncbi:MAG: iron-sulfur cluster assembly scaffold protein [Nanoarchaeota archaeon]